MHICRPKEKLQTFSSSGCGYDYVLWQAMGLLGFLFGGDALCALKAFEKNMGLNPKYMLSRFIASLWLLSTVYLKTMGGTGT